MPEQLAIEAKCKTVAKLRKKSDIKKFANCLVIREISSKFATFFRLYKRSCYVNCLIVRCVRGV